MKGYYVTFSRNECRVRTPQRGGVITIPDNKHGLYHLQAQIIRNLEPDESIFSVADAVDINNAHSKLGHMGEHYIRATYRAAGKKLKGTLGACDACMACKSKRKPIPKVTKSRSSMPGEKIFVDTTGPFASALDGMKYWTQVVDDATRVRYCYFLKTQNQIGDGLLKIVDRVKKYGHDVVKIRCNNARKNKKHIRDLADKINIHMEKAAPDMPQMNGVVKYWFAVLKDMGATMTMAAELTKAIQNVLWPEAVRYANIIYNITTNVDDNKTPYKRFTGKPPKLYNHLVQFGRIGYVKIHKKVKTNWTCKAQRMIVVGYGYSQSRDTYQFYNP